MADDALRMRAEVVDNASSTLRKIQRELQALSKDMRGAGSAASSTNFNRLKSEFSNLHGVITPIGRELRSVTVPALTAFGLTSAGLVASLAGVSSALRGFAERIVDLGLLSRETGLATNSIKAFSRAAEEVRISPEAAGAALREFSKHLFEVKQNLEGGIQVELYKRNAGDLVAALRGAKDEQEALNLVIERSEKILKTQGPQAARQFAEAWFANADAFRIGSGSLATWFEQLKDKTKDNEEVSKRYLAALNNLGHAFEELQKRIGVDLMPHLTEMVKGFDKWIEGNGDQFATRVATGVRDIADALKGVDWEAFGAGAGAALKQVGATFSDIAKTITEFRNLIEWFQGKEGSQAPLNLSSLSTAKQRQVEALQRHIEQAQKSGDKEKATALGQEKSRLEDEIQNHQRSGIPLGEMIEGFGTNLANPQIVEELTRKRAAQRSVEKLISQTDKESGDYERLTKRHEELGRVIKKLEDELDRLRMGVGGAVQKMSFMGDLSGRGGVIEAAFRPGSAAGETARLIRASYNPGAGVSGAMPAFGGAMPAFAGPMPTAGAASGAPSSGMREVGNAVSALGEQFGGKATPEQIIGHLAPMLGRNAGPLAQILPHLLSGRAKPEQIIGQILPMLGANAGPLQAILPHILSGRASPQQVLSAIAQSGIGPGHIGQLVQMFGGQNGPLAPLMPFLGGAAGGLGLMGLGRGVGALGRGMAGGMLGNIGGAVRGFPGGQRLGDAIRRAAPSMPPSGGAEGGGGPAPDLPGGSAFLRDQRAGAAAELNGNPALKERLAALVTLENEGKQASVGVVESMLNRQGLLKERGINASVKDMIYGVPGVGGGKSFYGPVRRGQIEARLAQLQRDPKRMQRAMGAIDRALGGSNVIKGATDQGSGNDPNVHWQGGKTVLNGETFNDWNGPGGHAAAQRFRERQQAGVAAEARQAQTRSFAYSGADKFGSVARAVPGRPDGFPMDGRAPQEQGSNYGYSGGPLDTALRQGMSGGGKVEGVGHLNVRIQDDRRPSVRAETSGDLFKSTRVENPGQMQTSQYGMPDDL